MTRVASEQGRDRSVAEAKPDTVGVPRPSRPAERQGPFDELTGRVRGEEAFLRDNGGVLQPGRTRKSTPSGYKSFGYEPEFFGFTEGRTAVGIGGTDDPEEAKAFMRELKGQDFCPEGVWILDRKKK